MPRIRTLKPEHKQHRKVARLSDAEYRLWIGLITEADDDGRLVADPAVLKALVWPLAEDVSPSVVAQRLSAVARRGLIVLYRRYGTQYAAFPSWRDHQRLDRHHYKPSALPPPVSAKTRRRLGIDSAESPRSQGSEGKGREGKGSEGKGGDRGGKPGVLSHPDSTSASTLSPDEERGLALVAHARGISVAQARSELATAKLRAIVDSG